jgi:hypothetical protein
MGRFSRKPPYLRDLSCKGIFSEGLHCPPDELLDRVGGISAIWTMYRNLGVIVDLLHWLERECDLSAIQLRSVRRLKAEAAPCRIVLLARLVTAPLQFVSARQDRIFASCVQAYMQILARTNLTVHDVDAGVMAKYIHFTGQQDVV